MNKFAEIVRIMKNADLLSASGLDVTISCESIGDRDKLFDILESLAMESETKDRIAEANRWLDGAALEAQRQSFAYGNARIHNPNITREMVAQESEKLRCINGPLKCDTCGEILSHEYASCKCGPRGVAGPS